MVVIPICLNGRCCSSGCMGVGYCINQDKDDESPPLMGFRRDVVNAIFLEYSKESKLSSSHLGIRNIPSDVYDYTK